MRIRAKSGGIRGKALLTILIVASAVALGMLGYTIANPPVERGFTEFYILGLNGKATDYPKELVVGKEAKVIVGIINREHEAVSYSVEIKINGVINNKVGPVKLNHNEPWEEAVSFTPDRIGSKQQVEFMFYSYKKGEPVFEEALYLQPIDVNEQE